MKTSSHEIVKNWLSVKKVHLTPMSKFTSTVIKFAQKRNCFQLQIMFFLQTLL